LPEGRPYNLGSTQAEQAAYAAPSDRTAYLPPRPSDRFQDTSRAASYDDERTTATRPVSAYAPIDARGPSEFLAGRGLY
jgi:rare lipoprotein A